jgi:hypothetical protein
MQAAQKELGLDIIIFKNHNQPVEEVSTFKWTYPIIHQKHFKLYQQHTMMGKRTNVAQHSTTSFTVSSPMRRSVT